jgi:hypothetical protein
MALQKFCQQSVVTILSDKNIQRACQLLRTYNIGYIIAAEEGKLSGILTDRDIALQVTGEGKSLERTTVHEVMTLEPIQIVVAQVIQRARLGTLLLDLLTKDEDASHETRIDIHLLARRLAATTQWLRAHPHAQNLDIGYFGASTGAAAAL